MDYRPERKIIDFIKKIDRVLRFLLFPNWLVLFPFQIVYTHDDHELMSRVSTATTLLNQAKQ